MDDVVRGFSTSEVVSALEANINAQLPLMYAHMPGVTVYDEPDLLGMTTDLPDPLLNVVYWAAFPAEQVEARVDGVLRRYWAWQRLPVTWAVSPLSQPQDLGRHLETRGFTHLFRVPGMAAELGAVDHSQPTLTGLAIERVQTVAQLEQWLQPVAASFDMPQAVASAFFELFAGQGFGPDVPWQLFVGLVGGQPVAASRLFCAAGVAGIYHVATVPGARGRGFGTALTLAAMRAGRDLGYRVGILAASGEGYGVYRQLGFRECCHADIYQVHCTLEER
jgi:ribosomal protein S18 acetylase RimI-like enzyme